MNGLYRWAEDMLSENKNLKQKLKAELKEKRELEQRLAAAETAIRWMVGIYMVQDGLPDDVREHRTKKVIEAVMMIGKNLTILSREVKSE